MSRPVLIHSNNSSLLSLFSETIHFQPSKNSNLDIDSQLTATVEDLIRSNPTIIFIKISLSYNSLELLGIRLAYHIRLSGNNLIEKLPIVFIGEESLDELLILSELSDIFSTRGIYLIKENTKFVKQIFDSTHLYPGIKEIKQFIERINVSPPANYSTHHSITNEWGIFRLSQLFKLDDEIRNNIDKALEKCSALHSLYFKFLRAKSGTHQKFNKGNQKEPSILGIEGKHIVLIDDELDKGWFKLLNTIFTKSGATFSAFRDFSKSSSKDDLLESIQSYLQEPIISSADLFIFDLRLCDEDFNERSYSKLSAILLTKFILRQNPGNQIMIFTASNKIWNYKEAIIESGAMGYAVKESPELNYSRQESSSLYTDFCHTVAKGCKRSHLKKLHLLNEMIKQSAYWKNQIHQEFYDKMASTNGWLDQYFNLLKLDTDKVLNQCLLILFQIFENYKDIWSTDMKSGVGITLRDKSFKKIFTEVTMPSTSSNDQKQAHSFIIPELGNYSFQRKSDESNRILIGVDFVSKEILISSHFSGLDNRFNLTAAALMHYNHNFELEKIRKFIELRFLRSNLSAHDTGKIDTSKRKVEIDDIHFLVGLIHEMGQ
ncbi:hypothetical protein [Chitinophaga sp.]|uniref:hypothetical protein n=1 Tax=Chitinophaga sp. TaxID=1869181 RepID=UPI0031E1B769